MMPLLRFVRALSLQPIAALLLVLVAVALACAALAEQRPRR